MSNIPKPEVGTKGRYSIGSDTYPITIISVSKSGKTIQARVENFKAGPGHDFFGVQNWIIEENPNGRIETFTWHPSNQSYRQNGYGWVLFNGWYAKQDPSY
jgi:hypothetical protein